jgi:hypothetical protein
MKNQRLTENNRQKSARKISFHFAIHQTISCQLAEEKLFEGMALKLNWVSQLDSISVTAFYDQEDVIVGVIPKGMNHHLSDVLMRQ